MDDSLENEHTVGARRILLPVEQAHFDGLLQLCLEYWRALLNEFSDCLVDFFGLLATKGLHWRQSLADYVCIEVVQTCATVGLILISGRSHSVD